MSDFDSGAGEPVDRPGATSGGPPTPSRRESGQYERAAILPEAEVYYASHRPGETIDEVLIEERVHRRRLLPLALFLATCCTTFFAGVYQWPADLFPFGPDTAKWVERNWWDGLQYMIAMLAILSAHEMGHFLMTVRYRVHASYPIVVPIPMYIGTMGAVIAMDGRRANRRQIAAVSTPHRAHTPWSRSHKRSRT